MNTTPNPDSATKINAKVKVAGTEMQVMTSNSEERLQKIEAIITENWDEFRNRGQGAKNDPDALRKLCLKLSNDVLNYMEQAEQLQAKLNKWIEGSKKIEEHMP